MKMLFEYDDKKEQPRVVFEGENDEDKDQLKILSAFKSVTFAVIVEEEEVIV
jgi:hypothetical protein